MYPERNHFSSIKCDGLIKCSKLSLNNCLLFNNKDRNRKFSNMKSLDITSRLGQFGWRQINPSNIIFPVIFRFRNREEYSCVQMIKLHLLSRISSERISYWMEKCPIRQFSLTIYEAELFDKINIFHSNGYFSINNQLDYSRLETSTITPFHSFIQFYQLIYSNSQIIHSNQFYISSNLSSTFNKSNKDKEKEVVNKMYESSKNVFSKKSESNNSFCRQINFHGKDILSYCTTSSIHLNEKDNHTISCLSIKDIVSIYFPWSSIEQFIQICRKKQITRFKPDKATDCDSTLRLVNIQELENHWNFILKELLPNTQTSPLKQNIYDDQSEKEKLSLQSSINNIPLTVNLSSNLNNEHQTKNVQLSLKENLNENCLTKDKTLLNNSTILLNDQINKSYQIDQQINNQNQLEEEQISSSSIHQNNSLTNNKSLKRNRRRRTNSYYSSKRRRKQKSKNKSLLNNQYEQFWINKYSIEPFSILIDRYQSP